MRLAQAVKVEELPRVRHLFVGTHGRGALARFFLGSVSTSVLEDPTSPTIAVR